MTMNHNNVAFLSEIESWCFYNSQIVNDECVLELVSVLLQYYLFHNLKENLSSN